jgi:RNA polymerase sigma-70 factor (ECF subfamily)
LNEPPAKTSRPTVRDAEPSAAGGTPRHSGIEPPSRDELLRLRNRDADAMAAFFDRYFDRIYALAHRMMGDREQAEEVTQDVFLRVNKGIGRLDPDRDPGPWLTTIVCNACREVWRGAHFKALKRSVSLDEVADWQAGHPRATGTPETSALTAERHQAVRQALRALPESLREVVVLYDYEGMNHKEIAAVLGATHAAVRKRYSRALAALAKALKDWR